MKLEILVTLFFCHFLADYTHLSTSWMLNAKKFGKPLYPIFFHALIHSVLMLLSLAIIFGIYGDKLMILFLIQLFSHFSIDLWKGKMNYFFPSLQSPANKWHWIIFGFDQFLHSFVIILMYQYAIS